MTDDQSYLHDADDPADEADLAFAAEAVRRLAFLRPDSEALDEQPLPDWAWERISRALAAESELRSAPRATAQPSGRSRATRWGGGLVAASVAIVAVGLGVATLRTGGSDVAVVAGEVPVVSAAADAEAFGAAPAPASSDALTAKVLEGPERMSFAGMVPPARMVVGSDTDYTAGALRTQVRSLLSTFGIGSEKAAETAMEAPTVVDVADLPPREAITSAQGLRDCIDKLMDEAAATALMVDLSTYEGQSAGVVVAPMDPAPAATSAPASAPSGPGVDYAELHVWVVDPDCDIETSLVLHLAP